MHYDHVDIGSCDFEFSDFEFRERPGNVRILLVEPLQMYLDNIPDNPNRTKANYAISNYNGVGKIHYINPIHIGEHNLGNHLRGCNSLNNQHVTTYHELKSKDLLHLYDTIEVNVITFERLVESYSITSIGKLKIDTEGHDHVILADIYEHIRKNEFEIEQIHFEYYANNVFGNALALRELIGKFESDLKYSAKKIDAYNVLLEKS